VANRDRHRRCATHQDLGPGSGPADVNAHGAGSIRAWDCPVACASAHAMRVDRKRVRRGAHIVRRDEAIEVASSAVTRYRWRHGGSLRLPHASLRAFRRDSLGCATQLGRPPRVWLISICRRGGRIECRDDASHSFARPRRALLMVPSSRRIVDMLRGLRLNTSQQSIGCAQSRTPLREAPDERENLHGQLSRGLDTTATWGAACADWTWNDRQ